jgi:hypothetical protein
MYDQYAGVSLRNVRLCHRILEVMNHYVFHTGIFFDSRFVSIMTKRHCLSFCLSFVYSVFLSFTPQSHGRCSVDRKDDGFLGHVILSCNISSSQSQVAEDSSLLGCADLTGKWFQRFGRHCSV